MKDKKNMAMIIVIGITLILFLCVNSTVFATTGTVVGSNLRVRKEESTTSEVIELLDENDKVEILGESGEWYKVKVNNKVGYVSKKFIKTQDFNTVSNENISSEEKQETVNEETKANQQPSEENKEEQPKQEETVAKVEQHKKVKFSADVELRVMPLISMAAMDVTSTSETYEVVSTVGLWSYVKAGEKEGWVLTEKSTEASEDNKEDNTNNEETKPEETKPEQSSTEKLYSKSKTYYVK